MILANISTGVSKRQDVPTGSTGTINPAELNPSKDRVQLESHVFFFFFPSSPSVKYSPVLLFHSRSIERFMSHRLSAGYLPQFFFFFLLQSASTSHACIHYSHWMKQWAQINLKHKRAFLSWLATKEIGKQRKNLSAAQNLWLFFFLNKLRWWMSINSRHDKTANLLISRWFAAISASFTPIHEGHRLICFEQNTICRRAHWGLQAGDRAQWIPVDFFFFSLSLSLLTAQGHSLSATRWRPFCDSCGTRSKAVLPQLSCPTNLQMLPLPSATSLELSLSTPPKRPQKSPSAWQREDGGRGGGGGVGGSGGGGGGDIWKMEGRRKERLRKKWGQQEWAVEQKKKKDRTIWGGENGEMPLWQRRRHRLKGLFL